MSERSRNQSAQRNNFHTVFRAHFFLINKILNLNKIQLDFELKGEIIRPKSHVFGREEFGKSNTVFEHVF